MEVTKWVNPRFSNASGVRWRVLSIGFKSVCRDMRLAGIPGGESVSGRSWLLFLEIHWS
jgi:hypothetical protein